MRSPGRETGTCFTLEALATMETRLETLVDVMRVPAAGEPRSALVSVVERSYAVDVPCDVLVVGGGTGGVAAALAPPRPGCREVLGQEARWPRIPFTAPASRPPPPTP